MKPLAPGMLVDPARVLELVLEKEGAWYIWGADGPVCFDCSGLIAWAVWQAGGPDWRATHNCQRMFDILEPVLECSDEVVLAFYGRNERQVSHVMLTTGDGRVFGACGGDSSCTSVPLARARPGGGARVKYRSSPYYRSDLLGYRRLRYATTEQNSSGGPDVARTS